MCRGEGVMFPWCRCTTVKKRIKILKQGPGVRLTTSLTPVQTEEHWDLCIRRGATDWPAAGACPPPPGVPSDPVEDWPTGTETEAVGKGDGTCGPGMNVSGCPSTRNVGVTVMHVPWNSVSKKKKMHVTPAQLQTQIRDLRALLCFNYMRCNPSSGLPPAVP